jgi:hypothetical protein
VCMCAHVCVCVRVCVCVCQLLLIIVSYYPVMDNLFGCIATVIVYLTTDAVRCHLSNLVKTGCV